MNPSDIQILNWSHDWPRDSGFYFLARRGHRVQITWFNFVEFEIPVYDYETRCGVRLLSKDEPAARLYRWMGPIPLPENPF